jgi:hypothetical protein
VEVLRAASAPPASAPPSLGRLAAADHALVQRVLAANAVDRTPAPPASSYFGEVFRVIQEAVLQALLRGARMLRLPKPLFLAFAVLAALAAILLIVRALLPRLRRSRRPPADPAATHELPAAARDAGSWRAELERCLAAGRTAEALLAAWWWLARSLAGSLAEPDWTSRDLVERAPRAVRPELAGLVRRLDALTYGPRRPTPEDVTSLVGRLEEVLS